MNDQRNITDEFKGKPHEEIKQILDTRRKPFGLLLCNLQYSLNTGNVVRTANAFSAESIIVYGRKKYDRRGAVGTYLYEKMIFARNENDLKDAIKGWTLVGLDNINGATPIHKFVWPDRPLIVCGHEAEGIAPEVLAACRHIVSIEQTGSVRSVNVATAAGIAVYDLIVKRGWYE